MPPDQDANLDSATHPKRGSNHTLIESIYRIALEPKAYDSFMELWGNHVQDNLEDYQSIEETSEPENTRDIARHFDIALQLLDQIQLSTASNNPNAKTDFGFNPQLLIDGNGNVVWYNASARNAFNLVTTSTIDALNLEQTQADTLHTMAASLLEPDRANSNATVFLKVQVQGHDRPTYLYARILHEAGKHDIILISKATPDWPDAMDEMLVSGFGLSQSETAICALISDGKDAAHIAEFRQSAITTVRTQIKKIMAKTSCSSQAELVRLLHSIMRIAEQSPIKKWEQPLPDSETTMIKVGHYNIPVNITGDPNGYPVVFIHGMLDSARMTREFTSLLKHNRIRLICPIRPFFGAAAGYDGDFADAPADFATDIMAMLASMGITETILVGHMAGAIYAYAVAANASTRIKIKGVISISGAVPIQSKSQFSSMSTRQQLVAFTARYTPKMLPFVLRAGISQLKAGGEKKFMNTLYKESVDDLPLTNDPEIFDIISTGFHFAVDQGYKAFQIDSSHVVRDWSEIIEQVNVPIHIIHGATDPVVSVSSVQKYFGKQGSSIRIEILDKTGQLALFKEPGVVIQAICNMRDVSG